MKIKGLRWVILCLIVLITIINYLDRGTLNYMWITNTKINYPLKNTIDRNNALPYAVYDPREDKYLLFNQNDSGLKVSKELVITNPAANSPSVTFIKKSGIAIDLGLVDIHATPSEINKQSKKLLSYIAMFFMVAYGVSQMVSGRIYDKIGTRKGFTFSVIIWALADMATSFAVGIGSLCSFRVLLGLGEAGPWPGVVKSNAEWFPVKERAFAQGFFGAGGSIGSLLSPVIISVLYMSFGWKNTFIVVGSLGLLWLIPWLIFNKKPPEEHPWITEEEKAHILQGREIKENNTISDTGMSWGELLRKKNSYAVIFGRFFLDPVWWMFVTWLPIYLSEVFKLDIKQIAFSAWVPYVGAAIGAISGGWFSGFIIKRTKSVNTARKIAVVIGACITLPAMIAAAYATTALSAVIIMSFILGGFQFSIVNIQTLASDFHSGKTVGSLAGLGGFAAVLGTIISYFLVPYITNNGNWFLFFAMGAILVPMSVISVLIFNTNKSKIIEPAG